RFNAERRKDRAQISGLVHDATTVETALLNGPRRRKRGDDDSCPGEGGSSTCGTIGTSASTKSNAYVEPSEPKKDPNFISLDQMRFMKYVYARVDGEKAAREHAHLMAQLVVGEKCADGLQARQQSYRRRSSGNTCDKEEALARNRASSTRKGPMLGLAARPKMNKAGDDNNNNHGVVAAGSGSRQRLLEKKRGILLEIKGVVSRQAEALDRLVESSANISGARKGRGSEGGGHCGGGRSFNGSNSGSFQSSSLPTEGTATHGCSRVSSVPLCHTTRSISCPDLSKVIVRTPSFRSSTIAGRPKAPLPLVPPRPPENDTSAFLARGGRWGRESRLGSSRRGSVTSLSSASYATYCKRDLGDGRTVPRASRRPLLVPKLPV
ncbi:unnamed protein product, partial [Hapterophycus canaliculatus]